MRRKLRVPWRRSRILALVAGALTVVILLTGRYAVGLEDGHNNRLMLVRGQIGVWRLDPLTWRGWHGVFKDHPYHIAPLWFFEHSDRWSYWQLRLPLWPLAAGSVITAFVFWRRELARPPGSCKSCGYSRRGLAVDAKCPECGTNPTK